MSDPNVSVETVAVQTAPARLSGSFRILFLYDIAEAIDLPKVRELLGFAGGTEPPGFPRRTPEYIRFDQPPVSEPRSQLVLSSGERLACGVKYYEFAVATVEVEVPFACDWPELLAQASRWMDAADLEPLTRQFLRDRLKRIAPAITKPNEQWLLETYLIANLQDARGRGVERPTGAQLLQSCGNEIVKLIRGELAPLAEKTTEEALQASLSYYPTDLVVIGSSGAFVYDRSEDAAATMQVLEYAKMQLLEFRYYDNWMSRLLTDIYTLVDRKQNLIFSRWQVPREAQRINALRLDVMDLTERIDNAIKFVSDVYYARVYRLAASRTGVNEYRDLVDEKIRTAGELYEFMTDQFNETRSFVIEVAVAILVLLDVILLLKQ